METSPAPWFVTTRSIPSGQALRIIDYNGGQVANVQRGNQLGNGYLIAASPTMLTTLELVDDYLAPIGNEEDAWHEIRSIIQSAIRKAKGQ